MHDPDQDTGGSAHTCSKELMRATSLDGRVDRASEKGCTLQIKDPALAASRVDIAQLQTKCAACVHSACVSMSGNESLG